MQCHLKSNARRVAWAVAIFAFGANLSQDALAQWTSRYEEHMDRLGGISTEELILYSAAITVVTIALVHMSRSQDKTKHEAAKDSTKIQSEENQNPGNNGTDSNKIDAMPVPLFEANNMPTPDLARPQTTRIVPQIGFAMNSRFVGRAKAPSFKVGLAIYY